MRLPSTLLGLLCWALVSRLLLPRLGRAGRLRGTPWIAALAFAHLVGAARPGAAARAVGRGRRRAGGPGGRAGAGHPAGAAARRGAGGRGGDDGRHAGRADGRSRRCSPRRCRCCGCLRGRTDLQLPGRGAGRSRCVAALARGAPASALLLMAADQGAAALAEAVRVRGLIGGGRPWYEEFERYALLLTPGRRSRGRSGAAPRCSSTLLAAAGLAWTLRRRVGPRVGIAAGPTRRLLVTLGARGRRDDVQPDEVDAALRRPGRARHGGAHAGAGRRSAARAPPALRDPATGAAAAGRGARRGDGRVRAGARRAEHVAVRLGLVHAHVQHAAAAGDAHRAGGDARGDGRRRRSAASSWRGCWPGRSWRQQRGRAIADTRVPDPSRDPGRRPRPLAVVLVAVLALQVLSLVRIAAAHPDGYTPTADAIATAAGDPCGLQSALLVETDPAAGVLAVAPQPDPRARRARARPPAARPPTVDAAARRCPASRSTGAGRDPVVRPRPPPARRRAARRRHRDRTARPGDVLARRVRPGHRRCSRTSPSPVAGARRPDGARATGPADAVRLGRRTDPSGWRVDRGRRRDRRRVAAPGSRAHAR